MNRRIIHAINEWLKEYVWVIMWVSAMLIPWPK